MALNQPAERLLRHFATWRSPCEAEAVMPGGEALVRQMLAAGVLVTQGSDEERLESAATPWTAIGATARGFHLATRTHAGDHFLTAPEDSRRLATKAAVEPPPSAYKKYPDRSARRGHSCCRPTASPKYSGNAGRSATSIPARR